MPLVFPAMFPALLGSKTVYPNELTRQKLRLGRQTWDDWATVTFAAASAIANNLNLPDSPPSQSDSTSGQPEEPIFVPELPTKDSVWAGKSRDIAFYT